MLMLQTKKVCRALFLTSTVLVTSISSASAQPEDFNSRDFHGTDYFSEEITQCLSVNLVNLSPSDLFSAFEFEQCIEEQDNIANNVNTVKPKIQVAILLDSSNSMDGLIEQARTQIWNLVNALSTVRKDGQIPILEVSVYHYGNDSLPSSEGFNSMLNELTTDLDEVSENLFSIKTNGGQEYAGWVIDSAINQLEWSDNPDDFRVIFIAGNEPFNQGKVNWKKAVNLAEEKDILVNTIYCGEAEHSESKLWADATTEVEGSSYFNLDQNQEIVRFSTPYDDEISELNRQLNDTYIPYVNQGTTKYNRMKTQDHQAKESGVEIERTSAKTSHHYDNSTWDLVDALGVMGLRSVVGFVDIVETNKHSLPQNLRSLTTNEQIKYIEKTQQEREEIKAEIANFSDKRNEYIRKNTAKSEQEDTLDNLMIKALEKQLDAKGFEFLEDEQKTLMNPIIKKYEEQGKINFLHMILPSPSIQPLNLLNQQPYLHQN